MLTFITCPIKSEAALPPMIHDFAAEHSPPDDVAQDATNAACLLATARPNQRNTLQQKTKSSEKRSSRIPVQNRVPNMYGASGSQKDDRVPAKIQEPSCSEGQIKIRDTVRYLDKSPPGRSNKKATTKQDFVIPKSRTLEKKVKKSVVRCSQSISPRVQIAAPKVPNRTTTTSAPKTTKKVAKPQLKLSLTRKLHTPSKISSNEGAVVSPKERYLRVPRERYASITSIRSSVPVRRYDDRRRNLNSTKDEVEQTPSGTMLTRKDFAQVGIMYQSQSSQVFICRCMANLYFCNVKPHRQQSRNWKLSFTGIPLLLLNYSQPEYPSDMLQHQIHIILAEKGTGFALWRDVITHASKYTQLTEAFHTMLPSNSHQAQQLGFSYDNAVAARQFRRCIQRRLAEEKSQSMRSLRSESSIDLFSLTADHRQPSAQHSMTRSRSYHSTATTTRKPPGRIIKDQISYPCWFQHVTSIRPADLSSIQRKSGRKSNRRPKTVAPPEIVISHAEPARQITEDGKIHTVV